MNLSHTEENYLKCIFKLTWQSDAAAQTNAIAAEMQTTAGTVTDMVRRLGEKSLIHYEKYKGAKLTATGEAQATQLVRRHRLWEVFLHDKLGFAWNEVHEMAEELEHISGGTLIERLDIFLGRPQFDPHGDPIPDANGHWKTRNQLLLKDLQIAETAKITGVNDHSDEYLTYLQKLGLTLGTELQIVERSAYDGSLILQIGPHAQPIQISEKVAQNLFVQTIKA